jgi:hypothetical protein
MVLVNATIEEPIDLVRMHREAKANSAMRKKRAKPAT